ncbi:MAG TPA: type II toxin-antitoxin system RelE/ParE family toxin [Candidatus Hydrogenedentes bacterium]|nr:type II toxin-antitoxin system RelE/ParE family toxin [Candidatus Hydrogenedentota bacterium]
MNYRLSPAAQKDMDDLWLFIARDNISAADHFISKVMDKFSKIAAHPNLGRVCEEVGKDFQRFPVDAYVIFYRIKPKFIEIVRILHSARDIESILKKEDFQ